MTLPQLLRIQEVAAATGLSERQIRNLIFSHRFPSVKIGRLLRFEERSILDWIAENSRDSGRIEVRKAAR